MSFEEKVEIEWTGFKDSETWNEKTGKPKKKIYSQTKFRKKKKKKKHKQIIWKNENNNEIFMQNFRLWL